MDIRKEKVLVTGADGFIGSHLTEALLAEGYQVRALCQYNSFNNWGWLEGVNRHSPSNLTIFRPLYPNVCSTKFCSLCALVIKSENLHTS